MPVPIAVIGLFDGIDSIPFAWTLLKTAPWLGLLWILKIYFGGARNTAERNMHSKVIMITGGTSGIGASVASNLARRGAQLVLLTQHTLDDPFLQDYILDLRLSTSNDLITAIQCDLSSLHSIRLFATKWIDNAPPRRLDMIILCANTLTPRGSKTQVSIDGVESNYAINYLANFHMLSILSPAIRAQPPDRDVRILFGTCASYMAGRVPEQVPRPGPAISTSNKYKTKDAPREVTSATISPAAAYANSKLALMTFADAFQKHLSSTKRPDKEPNKAKVFLVDPGWCRTPGMRRYLTRGSLLGLAIYLAMWPFWWLVLKSPEQGAQSFLHAAMEADFEIGEGGKLFKEVLETKIYSEEVRDEKVQKRLWEASEKAVEALEKEQAGERARRKKELEDVDEKQDARMKRTSDRKASEASEEKSQGKSKMKEGSRRVRKAMGMKS